MQRLSKAIEDTAKDAQNAADDAAATNADASIVENRVSANDAAASVEDVMLAADGGREESKSSDDGEGARVEDKEAEPQVPTATAKWHRELCSLAEMGFENTARNIDLLEKHVTTSGGPGMER